MSWTTYKGLEVPSSSSGDAGIYLTSNFEALADRSVYASSSDPTTSNDSTQGFAAGSLWQNTTTLQVWQCVSASVCAAVWQRGLFAGPPVLQSISYASTITPDGSNPRSLANVGTLTGNLTIAAPSGTAADGNELGFRFVQDGTGGRTISWNSAFAFGTDITTGLIPTAANAKWEMKFVYNSTASKWRALALARGF